MRPSASRSLGSLVGAALILFGAGVVRAGDKAKVSTLAACPAWGAEERATPRGLLNEVKRRFPTATSPVLLDFGDVASLQQQSDALVRTGKDAPIMARERARLRGFTLGGRRVGEGDLVAITGFLVGKPEANVGESVNCYLRGPSNNDFHIAFGATPQAPVREAIVAEMIPQDRPKAWTLGRLRRISADRRRVLIVGQLMLDSIHAPGDEPRASLWEVHPVTKFLVCGREANDCDPNRDEQWQPLESTNER